MTDTTTHEQSYIQSFSERMNVLNTKEILSYGAVPQKKSISFINNKLPDIPSGTNAEICTDLKKLIKQMETLKKACNDHDWKEKGSSLISRTEKAINEAARRFELHISSLVYHLDTLEERYTEVLHVIHEFDMYIAAGDLCLNRTLHVEIEKQKKIVDHSVMQEDLLLLKDYEAGYQLLQKKLDSLRVSQQIPLQSATHIRLVQQTEQNMIENLRTLIADAFPLWKSAMVFANGVSGNQEFPSSSQVYSATATLLQTLQNILKIYQNITQ